MLIGLGGLLTSEIVVLLPAWAYECEGAPCKCYTCDPNRPNSRDRDDPPAEESDLRSYDFPNVSEYVAGTLRGKASSVERDFLTARGGSIWAILVLRPADQKSAFGDAVHHADGMSERYGCTTRPRNNGRPVRSIVLTSPAKAAS